MTSLKIAEPKMSFFKWKVIFPIMKEDIHFIRIHKLNSLHLH